MKLWGDKEVTSWNSPGPMPQFPLAKSNSNQFQERRCRQEAWKLCFQETNNTHISTIPKRVASIFASGETANSQECAAAELCCCQLCADAYINTSKLDSSMRCASCGRSGCQVCISQRSDGRKQCNSRVCGLVSKLHIGTLNLQTFCIEANKLSRMLMQQWLVLQFKQERQLGSLRAYFLVQSRYAALLCLQAADLIKCSQNQNEYGAV